MAVRFLFLSVIAVYGQDLFLSSNPMPKVVEQDVDTDYVCCDMFDATHAPPDNWRTRFPGGVPGRPDTVPAENVSVCIDICASLFYPEADRNITCKAAAWNGPKKQCYLKTGKDNMR